MPNYGLEEEFGFTPIFTLRGRRISAGNVLAAARADGSLTLDYSALNVFFRTDLFLNGATPFAEVRRICPPPRIVAEEDRTREEAIDGYAALFRQAVARRATENSVVALSGGRDSRHIICELHAQGRLPDEAVTVALSMNNDLDVARKVARVANVRHVSVPANRTVEGARYTVRATDFMSTQHAWFADVARTRDSRAWWDGIAGDVLSAGLFLEEWNARLFAEQRLDELAERLVRPGRVPYFRDQTLFPRLEAVSLIREELSRHVNAANPVGSFYFWNRTRVNIAASALSLLRPAGQQMLLPFLDRDLWYFLASLPLRLVRDHKLHEDVIRKTYPEFASIGYSQKHKESRWSHRRLAASAIGSLLLQRQSRASRHAILQLLRSIVLPWRAGDVDWVISTFAYIDQLTCALNGSASH